MVPDDIIVLFERVVLAPGGMKPGQEPELQELLGNLERFCHSTRKGLHSRIRHFFAELREFPCLSR